MHGGGHLRHAVERAVQGVGLDVEVEAGGLRLGEGVAGAAVRGEEGVVLVLAWVLGRTHEHHVL